MADKIGRRKVMILTVLNFSIPTGLMALTPNEGWLFLSLCRFFVGMGVTGLYTVDTLIVQEFVPAYKRGWVTGLTTSLLPAGALLGALLGAYAERYIGWRGLFAVGLLPAGLSLLIRAWVPESPHWLIGKGRFDEARRSLAWALQVDPRQIELPPAAAAVDRVAWRELFKYPRSIAASCLTGISQTGSVGLSLVDHDAARARAQDRPGRGVVPGDLHQHRRDRRTVFLLVPVGRAGPPPLDRVGLPDRGLGASRSPGI